MAKSGGFLSSLFSKGPSLADLPFETDMHSHVLPGVDDGFKDIGHSCRAAAELAGLGVKNMILTPHIYPELYPENDYAFITGRFAGLQARLSEASGINFGSTARSANRCAGWRRSPAVLPAENRRTRRKSGG